MTKTVHMPRQILNVMLNRINGHHLGNMIENGHGHTTDSALVDHPHPHPHPAVAGAVLNGAAGDSLESVELNADQVMELFISLFCDPILTPQKGTNPAAAAAAGGGGGGISSSSSSSSSSTATAEADLVAGREPMESEEMARAYSIDSIDSDSGDLFDRMETKKKKSQADSTSYGSPARPRGSEGQMSPLIAAETASFPAVVLSEAARQESLESADISLGSRRNSNNEERDKMAQQSTLIYIRRDKAESDLPPAPQSLVVPQVPVSPSNAAANKLAEALDKLRQVDLILEQLGVFWANTEVVLDLLTKKGQHVEHFIGFASKPRLMERFRERMEEYKRFWENVGIMCRNYLLGVKSPQSQSSTSSSTGP